MGRMHVSCFEDDEDSLQGVLGRSRFSFVARMYYNRPWDIG
jgi:hypothetical protein